MNTWHIHIKGQVQGVGFRPFIFRLAQQENLNGWVYNTMDGVHIEFNANEKTARAFLKKIETYAPAISSITSCHILPVKDKKYDRFSIMESRGKATANLLLSPDFTICFECRNELYRLNNRRRNYPFITCTNCGPRYSIIKELPYDRIHTTMDMFDMCEDCREEYQNPNDRRFFSQTNSCPSCAITLSLFDKNKNAVSGNDFEIIEQVLELWKEGEIIAIKGIGGYLLTCDAENENTTQQLRQRKYRPTKPFALMFPNLETIKKEVTISEKEAAELQNYTAPIVLCNLKNNIATKLKRKVIAPNLHQIGTMLPYTPLFDLLLKKFGKPIVATSGNISNSPIVFDDEKALNELPKIADYVLVNNRRIVVPQDDSVVKFSFFKKQKIIIRRSRGMAPSLILPNFEMPSETIFAAGAMLKSSFTFIHQNNIFISQYLGDLEHFDTLESYRLTVRHFFNLFKSQPELILSDTHPDYASAIFAEQLTEELKCPLFKVQHHLAHFAACLGEHTLIHSDEPVLGVIWDGTGLGLDGNIWGGEFFIYRKYQFERSEHISYFNFILGNKMPKEPRISALSACKNITEALLLLKKKFSDTEWNIYQKLLAKNEGLQTSSMGRLFDAVASLLGICDRQSYEGEAAMLLENKALEYFKEHGLDFREYYLVSASGQTISTRELVLGIIRDIVAEKPLAYISAKFHFSLLKMIAWVAEKNKVQKIAFSGGVFQNGVLVDLILHHLRKKYETFFHERLSPNDENVSFGQVIYYKILNHGDFENHHDF